MSVSVAQITESAQTSNVTAHTVNFTQTTGDLVVIFFACHASRTLTLGDGFTNWTNITNTFHVIYKILDGSEGGDVTITTDTSCKSASVAYNIQGSLGGGLAISTVATGTSTAPNATSVAPGWGATFRNTLFITAFHQAGEEADDDTWCTVPGGGYGNLAQKTTGTAGTATTNCQMASAHRLASVVSEDAGAFTTAQSLAWRAYTIAVQPQPTAAITGTITPSANETDIVAGGKTLIITLTDDNWIAAGAGSFGLVRQDIIDGCDSAQSEATGWNLVPKLTQNVAGVVRTSDTVVTITWDAFATYNITAQESITVTVPASALLYGGPELTATPIPAFTINTAVTETIQDLLGGILPFPR